MIPRRTLLLVALVLAMGCSSSDGNTLPSQDVVADIAADLQFADAADVDVTEEEACRTLWKKTTFTSGASSHAALGKNDVLYVTGGHRVYAIAPTSGAEQWIWPDPSGTDEGYVELPEDTEQLYTPVIGAEGDILLGSQRNRLICLNKNGVGIFAVDTDGPVTGAPAILSNGNILVLSDNGQRMKVIDLGIQATGDTKNYVLWEFSGDNGTNDILPAQQPLVASLESGDEFFWVVAKGAVYRYRTDDGSLIGTTQLPEGQVATSNGILDETGAITVATGEGVANAYFMKHYLVTVDADGVLSADSPALIHEGPTKVVSLSGGRKETLLVGTNNSGFMLYSLKFGETLANFYQDSFQDVAPAVQGLDGLVYFSAFPHWIYVISEAGELVWFRKLEEPDDLIGANLAPSSPILRDDGVAIFHNGNFLHAVQCTEAGPAAVVWPRFGGNRKNTGNLADSEALKQE